MVHRANQNIFLLSLRFLAVDIAMDILYWPLWWYSRGVVYMANFCIRQIREEEHRVGLALWMKNILVPMFAQYDWQGRIISFFMRLAMIFMKSIFLSLWAMILCLFFLLYIFLPAMALWRIILAL